MRIFVPCSLFPVPCSLWYIAFSILMRCIPHSYPDSLLPDPLFPIPDSLCYIMSR
ncbi:MAG: hypothetical protein F6K26_49625 [Moorea sp. SIO2I5]|nr:hypothetical protein [Moorena sp. SIO2I5]